LASTVDHSRGAWRQFEAMFDRPVVKCLRIIGNNDEDRFGRSQI